MAESDFSWFKIASFFAVAILVLLAFVLVGGGIYAIVGGQTVYGVAGIVGGCLSVIVAWWVYRNYQNKTKR